MQKAIGDKAAASLAARYGTRYTVGNIAETICKQQKRQNFKDPNIFGFFKFSDIAAGGSMDWAKYHFGTRITYTYELRDTGSYGFLLPPEQIIPTALETLDSFITIFQEALAPTK